MGVWEFGGLGVLGVWGFGVGVEGFRRLRFRRFRIRVQFLYFKHIAEAERVGRMLIIDLSAAGCRKLFLHIVPDSYALHAAVS